jgi:hypothetical protein
MVKVTRVSSGMTITNSTLWNNRMSTKRITLKSGTTVRRWSQDGYDSEEVEEHQLLALNDDAEGEEDDEGYE